MKTRNLIVLSGLIACLVWVPGASAETWGYEDDGDNVITGKGVLGVIYSGNSAFGSAIFVEATGKEGGTFGGYFTNHSSHGVAVRGECLATSGNNQGGHFSSWSPEGSGVYGVNNAATGGAGGSFECWGGYCDAVYGEAHWQNAIGGLFKSRGEEGIGVWGYATHQEGTGMGGYFWGESPQSTGVFAGVGGDFPDRVLGSAVNGVATMDSGETYGGYFENWSSEGVAVYGYATSIFGNNWGGYFLTESLDGTGVEGNATAEDGQTFGGYFSSASKQGTGVQGAASSKSGLTYGGKFVNESTGGRGVAGVASAKTGKAYGGAFESKSSKGVGAYGLASNTKGENVGVYGETKSPDGYGVYSKGNMRVVGDQTVTGSKSAVVKLKNGEGVTLYAVEAAENWFEDFGSSRLKDGGTVVEIDPTYAETVNTGVDYHVFLTPRGECRGLYVANQKEGSFEVRELNGGKSDIPFSYRIVAKRKGYEDLRLVKVKDETVTAMATSEADLQEPEPMEVASR